jgi:hypothetical protein
VCGLEQSNCWICGEDVLSEDNFCRNCGVPLAQVYGKKEARQTIKWADHRVSVGVFLAVVGGIVGVFSYLFGMVPMIALGLASFLIGIMVLYLPNSEFISGNIAADSSLPSLLNIENLLEDLDLDERGIYIPSSGFAVPSKVFVPLAITPATKQPPLGLLESHRIFVTVGKNAEDRGVLLEAPGSGILVSIERSLNVDLSNIQPKDLQSSLNSGFKALGIAKVTNVEHMNTDLRIQMELTSFFSLETKLRNLAPRLSTHIGTPIASAVAGGASKATGKYVTITNAILDPSNRKMNIDLKLTASARKIGAGSS